MSPYIYTVGPGYDDCTTRSPCRTRDRNNRQWYTSNFNLATIGGANWILLETFNFGEEGTAIDNVANFGTQYLDLTKSLVDKWRSSPSPTPTPKPTPPPSPSPTPTSTPSPSICPVGSIDCAQPGPGCHYEGGNSCSCGNLVCTSPAPTLVFNPVYYWSLDDPTGPTVGESIKGNNGTAVGNAVNSVPGKVNQARQFSSQADQINTAPVPLGLFDMSIGAWVYPTGSGEIWNVIASQWRDSTFGAWNFSYSPQNKLHFHIRSNCGITLGVINGNNSFSANQWHYLAVTRNNQTGETKLYIDGTLDNSAILPTGQICGVPLPITFGRFSWDGTQRMVGKLDEVEIWDKVLSDQQVASLAK